MGTWGQGPFDNDGALDWFNRLEACEPRERADFVARTFAEVADDTSYIQADDGESVVAAAALVALNLPAGSSMTVVSRPEHLDDDVLLDVTDELCHLGVRALDRVAAGNSELSSLWGGDTVFLATLAQIRKVLARA